MLLTEITEATAAAELENVAELQNVFQVLSEEAELRPLLECYTDEKEENFVPLPPDHLAGKLVRLLGMPDTEDENWDGRVPVILLNPFDFSPVEPIFLLPLPALVEADPEHLKSLLDQARGSAQEQPGTSATCEGDVDEGSVAEEAAGGSSSGSASGSAAAGDKPPGARVEEVVEEVAEPAESASASISVPGVPERHRESEQYMVKHLATETLQEAFRRFRDCAPAKRKMRRLREARLVRELAADTIKAAMFRHANRKRSDSRKVVHHHTAAAEAESEQKEKEPEVDWSQAPLPEGWEQRLDPERNRLYYVDHNTRITQWKHPASIVPIEKDDTPNNSVTNAGSTRTDSSSAARPPRPNPSPVIVPTAASVEPDTTEEPETVLDHFIAGTALSAHSNVVQDAVANANPHPVMVRRNSRGANSAVTGATRATAATVSSGSSSAVKDSRRNRDRHSAWTVLDEAHSDAVAAQARRLTFSPAEATKLLDALDCELSAEASGADAGQVLAGLPDLQLPLLHQQSLAAAITAYARANFLVAEPRQFSLSEAQAAKAMQRLHALLEGAWLPLAHEKSSSGQFMRTVILDQCDGSLGRAARPSYWGERQTARLIKLTCVSSGKIDEMQLDGAAFLEMPMSEMAEGLPALLQARIRVIQHTLQLVDQWWEVGHRPGDPWRALASSTLATLSKPFAVVTTGDGAARKKDKKQRRSKASAKAPQQQQVVGENREAWGFIAAERSSNNSPLLVELAPQEALLQAWMPLNRAYGWGISLECLTAVCSRLGGTYAFLDSATLAPRSTATSSRDPPAGCVWMRLKDDIAIGTENALLQCNLLRNIEHGQTEALVPLSCVRKASIPTMAQVGGRAAIDPCDLHIGASVRIADKAQLLRACERFEWWDRPPADVLAALAGQRAVVVAVVDVHSRGRVGVRVPSKGVFDAVPLEALYLDKKLAAVVKAPVVVEAPAAAVPAKYTDTAAVPVPAQPAASNAAGKNKRRIARSAALRGGHGYVVPPTKPVWLETSQRRLAESEKEVQDFYLNELQSDKTQAVAAAGAGSSAGAGPETETEEPNEADMILPRIRATVSAPLGPSPDEYGAAEIVPAVPPSNHWQVLSFDPVAASFQLGPGRPDIGAPLDSPSPPRKPRHKHVPVTGSPIEVRERPASAQERPAVLVPVLDPSVGYDVANSADQAVRAGFTKKQRPRSAFRAGAPNAMDPLPAQRQPKKIFVGKENEKQLVGKGGLVPEAWTDGKEFLTNGQGAVLHHLE